MEGIDLIVLLLFGIPFSVSGKFTVTGPSQPVIAIVGEDALLDCQLVPERFVSNMVLRWFKSDFGLPVHAYRNGQDDTVAQHKDYRGRTELFKDEVTKGNVSLRIKNTRVFDEGKYLCTVDDKTDIEETEIELKVGALGREHWIQIDGYHKNGIQLVCESNGWFPKPQILWTHGDGQNLKAQSEMNYQQDSKGLINVQSFVAVTRDATNRFQCLIQNKLLKKEQEAAIQISDDFFPTVSGWLVFLSVILCLLIVAFTTGIVWIVKQLRNIKELQHDKTIKQFDQWKSVSDSDWKNIFVCAAPVTLDTETANPRLEVSKDLKNVRLTQTERSIHDSAERFTVWESLLGSEGFTSGAHYWEVEVAGNQHWTLGVAKETVDRKKDIQLLPQNGFWTIVRAEDKFQVNSDNQPDIHAGEIPMKIGVYLSYDSRRVSFYGANRKVYLYTFTGCEFTEKLYPFFSTTHLNKWLRICPVQH
ncbi:butyrophilin subfamily 3 member A3-like isoform X1 [Carcharodon carcharias]|uniref:butyrophilin subfamily 3 member A3-like isoform X1 n=1 Tax=Carcharodon carcharias TaxID=13397 RepID=UPI001B7F0C97|nr:butyrophilin subfamily 3 member A3-like isoform X1 [Carcharodon carcharias]XP_041068620.1 butyrophilin subfamily 3 member A3-like isoform X1 [Carcharodon carcharias]XP_041068621.1 butyrophilin subfamily 3 member A3-like isoform X1 [Carcharodon carcharias]XP_041068622.1 butyrophilin subfamily 3 member A3-like isoform X1 [Carcharodon carcharias]